jgi:hypothetical protein
MSRGKQTLESRSASSPVPHHIRIINEGMRSFPIAITAPRIRSSALAGGAGEFPNRSKALRMDSIASLPIQIRNGTNEETRVLILRDLRFRAGVATGRLFNPETASGAQCCGAKPHPVANHD